MEQFTFGNGFEEAPAIVNVSEPHMALLFLLDTSGSMGQTMRDEETGEMVVPIDELNKALNRFKEEVCQDEKTRDILDVAIVEFNQRHKVIQEFTPIEQMKIVELKATGQTYMKDALAVSIQMVDDRARFYRRVGTEPYKPWIVLISDGWPMDDPEEMEGPLNQLRDMTEKGKLALWSLCVPGANEEALKKFSGARTFRLKGYDFKGFLDWTHKSMRAVSASAPGEKPQAQAIPDTMDLLQELM